jgi:hypothetical protein
MRPKRPAAATNFPITICQSVRGEVARSSIVPCFFSSAKSLMVSMGATKSATTAMFWTTGRMRYSLIESLGPPPNSIDCWAIRIDCSRNMVRAKEKKAPKRNVQANRDTQAMGLPK